MTLQEYIESKLFQGRRVDPRHLLAFQEDWKAAHPEPFWNNNHNTDYLALPGCYTRAELRVLQEFFGDKFPPYPTHDDLFPKPSGPTLWEHLDEA